MTVEDDRLANLLRRADATCPTPPPRGLAQAARRRWRRRRLRNGTCAALLGAAAIAAVVVRVGRREEPPAPVVARAPDSPTQSVEDASAWAIADDIERHEHVVDELLLAERRRASLATLASLRPSADPAADLREGRERTAQILIEAARNAATPEAARDAYREVASLFPDTAGAGYARERLNEVQ